MSERLSPIVELTKARFREFLREPGAVFWSFGFPIILALALGVAFRSQSESKPRVGLLEGSPAWLVKSLTGDDTQVEVSRLTADQVALALRQGRVDLVVEAKDPERPEVVYRYDPARDAAKLARYAVDATLQEASGREDVLTAEDIRVEAAGERYVDFLFPGIVGMNLMTSSIWGIGYSIVLARKRRQLKRLAATPMRRWHLMLAIFLSRLVFLSVEIVAILGFGSLVFGVSIEGSPIALGVISLMGSASFAAIALTVAARVESVEAANGWLNFVTLPMWMLSGTFFSYERFPEVVQPVIRLLPLTALNDALRAVINDGVSVFSTAPQLAVMLGWSLVCFVWASRRFRWQ
ncbi:MAG: ABC transporter permease [Planctomycetota bacterium]